MNSTRWLVAFLLTSCSLFAAHGDWKSRVQDAVPLFGHRNWIVIADSAYPDQSAPGIETIVADAEEPDVLSFVLNTLAHAPHVTPIVYNDKELTFLDEEDAPGISAFREQLGALLQDRPVKVLPHEQIIAKLDDVSRSFHVLLIKTKMKLPYTSVFLQLDCAYWPPDAERRLRQRMAAAKK